MERLRPAVAGWAWDVFEQVQRESTQCLSSSTESMEIRARPRRIFACPPDIPGTPWRPSFRFGYISLARKTDNGCCRWYMVMEENAQPKRPDHAGFRRADSGICNAPSKVEQLVYPASGPRESPVLADPRLGPRFPSALSQTKNLGVSGGRDTEPPKILTHAVTRFLSLHGRRVGTLFIIIMHGPFSTSSRDKKPPRNLVHGATRTENWHRSW